MRKRVAALLALTLVLVALAGCGGLQTAGEVPTGQDARQGYAAVDAVAGTVAYHYESATNRSVTRAAVVKRPTQGMVWRKFLAPERLAGDVTVTNGTVAWRYDASERTATRTSLGTATPTETNTTAFVGRVFATLSESEPGSIVADPMLPVGPLSVNNGEHGPKASGLIGRTEFVLEYAGTEQVAGRQTYRVEFDPVNTTGDGLGTYVENMTYWFDVEYFVPLKTTTRLSINGTHTRTTKRYTNVTFASDVEAGRFQFDPPANATVETQSVPRPTTFDTAQEAARSVPFDVATPTSPPEYELEMARVSRFRNRTTVSLEYSNATSEFSVVTRNPPLAELDGRTVSIGPVSPTRMTVSNITVYRWRCGGIEYTVRGDLPRSELRDIVRDAATACTT